MVIVQQLAANIIKRLYNVLVNEIGDYAEDWICHPEHGVDTYARLAYLTPPPEECDPPVPNSRIYISACLSGQFLLNVRTDIVALQSEDGPSTMKLFKDCWVALLDVFSALTGTPTDGSQQSLGFGPFPGHGHVPKYPFPPKKPSLPTPSRIAVPIFAPPSVGETPDSTILCDYTAMGPGWGNCSNSEDRGCWLKGPNGKKFTIDTDYETLYPKGVTRKVWPSICSIIVA